jgi:DNA-binding transcriptional ArsR family regulator
MEELDELFESVAGYFRLLAEPTRLKVIRAICRDERSVTDIVNETGITQSNVSRHLNMLYTAGVVSRRRTGNVVSYKVSDPILLELCRMVCVRIAAGADEPPPQRETLLGLYAE